MSTNIRQLMHPELMTEAALLEILKSRCVEIPNVKNLKKSDLVEMFKRVALPMPQRRYNESRYLGKKLNDLRLSRKISIGIEEEQALYDSVISDNYEQDNKSNCKKLKSDSEDISSMTKKIHLTNPSVGANGVPKNGLKHKINDKGVSAQKEVKKRQKITWP